MKKFTTVFMMFFIAFTFLACGSDDNDGDDDGRGNNENNEKQTYGSFSVFMKINNEDVTYKYLNYDPIHGEGSGLYDTHLVLSDAFYYDSQNGDFPGGTLSITINGAEGTYTIVDQVSYALHAHDNPTEYKNLAYLSLNIGTDTKDYKDAKYVSKEDEIYVNKLVVTRDEKGVLHYNIKDPIEVMFIGGAHGAGNTSAPQFVKVTAENGHY